MSSNSVLQIAVASAILHPRLGGPAVVLKERVRLTRDVINYRVFGVADSNDVAEIKTAFPEASLFSPCWPRRWHAARGIARAMLSDPTNFDLFHAHMLWDYPVWAAHRAARARRVPLVITPHGSVIAVWRTKRLHKMLYAKTFLRMIQDGNTYFQVLNETEAIACRRFGIESPIKVIPNGVPASSFTVREDPALARAQWPQLRDKRILLFMGRVWREKGLDVLLEAWKSLCAEGLTKEWVLAIAGPDYRGYTAELQGLIAKQLLGDSVFLLGGVYGSLKASLFAAASCFVLPSRSEAMSVAIIEAMAAGLPVVYSPECNFPELQANGGGWETNALPADLSERLATVMSLSPAELSQNGQRGRDLGVRDYTLEGVAKKLVRFYRCIARPC